MFFAKLEEDKIKKSLLRWAFIKYNTQNLHWEVLVVFDKLINAGASVPQGDAWAHRIRISWSAMYRFLILWRRPFRGTVGNTVQCMLVMARILIVIIDADYSKHISLQIMAVLLVLLPLSLAVFGGLMLGFRGLIFISDVMYPEEEGEKEGEKRDQRRPSPEVKEEEKELEDQGMSHETKGGTATDMEEPYQESYAEWLFLLPFRIFVSIAIIFVTVILLPMLFATEIIIAIIYHFVTTYERCMVVFMLFFGALCCLFVPVILCLVCVYTIFQDKIKRECIPRINRVRPDSSKTSSCDPRLYIPITIFVSRTIQLTILLLWFQLPEFSGKKLEVRNQAVVVPKALDDTVPLDSDRNNDAAVDPKGVEKGSGAATPGVSASTTELESKLFLDREISSESQPSGQGDSALDMGSPSLMKKTSPAKSADTGLVVVNVKVPPGYTPGTIIEYQGLRVTAPTGLRPGDTFRVARRSKLKPTKVVGEIAPEGQQSGQGDSATGMGGTGSIKPGDTFRVARSSKLKPKKVVGEIAPEIQQSGQGDSVTDTGGKSSIKVYFTATFHGSQLGLDVFLASEDDERSQSEKLVIRNIRYDATDSCDMQSRAKVQIGDVIIKVEDQLVASVTCTAALQVLEFLRPVTLTLVREVPEAHTHGGIEDVHSVKGERRSVERSRNSSSLTKVTPMDSSFLYIRVPPGFNPGDILRIQGVELTIPAGAKPGIIIGMPRPSTREVPGWM